MNAKVLLQKAARKSWFSVSHTNVLAQGAPGLTLRNDRPCMHTERAVLRYFGHFGGLAGNGEAAGSVSLRAALGLGWGQAALGRGGPVACLV